MNPYNVSKIIFIGMIGPIFFSDVKYVKYKYDDLALKKCEHSISSPWTVHGWWPEYSHNKWPQFCDPKRYSEFSEEVIKPIRQKLDLYWSSCPGYPPALNLWEHEWKKHGTCIIPQVSVVDYFNHTINAFLQSDKNNYYDCCDSLKTQCMIPFAMPINETKWLGYCYK
jgi:ribonuclease I